jgi:hypothetical protein
MMPAWALAAVIFMCPAAGGTCMQQHVDGIEKSWCGKSARGWTDGIGEIRVTVRCK